MKATTIKKPTFSDLEKEKISATPERRKEIQKYLDFMYWGIENK